MTTTSNPRASPGGLSDALQADVDRYLRRSEQQRQKNARRQPKTDEQLAREALRSRLRKMGRRVEEFAVSVEEIQGDRSGDRRFGWGPLTKPPADNRDLRGPSPTRPGLLDQWERVEREAAEGCELSQTFVAKFGPMFRLALDIRHQRPPPRAADYDPLEGMTADQRATVERARRY